MAESERTEPASLPSAQFPAAVDAAVGRFLPAAWSIVGTTYLCLAAVHTLRSTSLGWSAASVCLLAFAATGIFLHDARRRQIAHIEALHQDNVARAVELDESEQRVRTLAENARDLDRLLIGASLAPIVVSVERARRPTARWLACAGGKPCDEPERDLAAEVDGVVDLLRSSIPSHAEIHFDFDPEPPVVRADPDQLRQPILDLVINPAESRDTGPVRVAIAVRTESLDAHTASALSPAQARPSGRYAALGASEVQGVGFLRKPFTQAQLAECVRELLGSSG